MEAYVLVVPKNNLKEAKRNCYQEIATVAHKWKRAADAISSSKKAKKSTAQTEQPT